MAVEFQYDVFLSHASADKAAVRELAQRLKGDGLRVWLDEWVIQPGDSIPLAIERGLESSRTLVLVMSQAAFDSEWVTLERHTAIFRDPTNQQRRFIPLRLDDCNVKDSLKQFAYVDWRNNDDAKYAQLLGRCGGEPRPDERKNQSDLIRPVPVYRSEIAQQISERSLELRRQRRTLLVAGNSEANVTEIDQELLELKRQFRDGPQLEPGDCLSDQYLLLEKIGTGGFATVWRAFDEDAEHTVAIKVLHGQYTGSSERVDRFRRGSQVMRKLRHPNIVSILNQFTEDSGYVYFAMEFVSGGTLFRGVRDQLVTTDNLVSIICQICDALEYAHSCNAIHRDVTPDNILLDSSLTVAKLSDFDLVWLASSTGGTRTGALGKFIYAAPESLLKASEPDVRFDVFSVGMTAVFGFYGGVLPIDAFTTPSSFIRQLPCPASVKPVLECAIDHEPSARFETVMQFRKAIESAIAGSANTQRQTPQHPVPHWDAESHTLTFHGQIVKRFKWPAVNQQTILMVFQEEGWPVRIDDPLPPQPEQDSRRRLSDTIKCLNRKQTNNLIHFRGDGTGEGVIWEADKSYRDADNEMVKINRPRWREGQRTELPGPHWDAFERTLKIDGQIVKQFRWRAMSQEMILSAFQEDGWPVRIDDPLPPRIDGNTKRRLSDTIRHLNSHQKNQLIRFRGDGTGKGVIWELVSNE